MRDPASRNDSVGADTVAVACSGGCHFTDFCVTFIDSSFLTNFHPLFESPCIQMLYVLISVSTS